SRLRRVSSNECLLRARTNQANSGNEVKRFVIRAGSNIDRVAGKCRSQRLPNRFEIARHSVSPRTIRMRRVLVDRRHISLPYLPSLIREYRNQCAGRRGAFHPRAKTERKISALTMADVNKVPFRREDLLSGAIDQPFLSAEG